SVDRRAYVSKKEDGWLFSGRCLRVRVKDPNIINPLFLSYYFGQFTFKEHVRSIAVGATMPSINTKILSNIEVELPRIEYQNKVVKLLKCIDDKIELNNAISKNLKEMAQAHFKRWFIDFEFPDENGEPYKSSGGEFEESELGLIPKGWKVGVFHELTIDMLGGDWGKETPQGNYTEEVVCIRGADIPEITKGNIGKVATRYILKKNSEKKRLFSGDVVIEISGGSSTQSTGRSVLINEEILTKFPSNVICTNFCRVIKPMKDFSEYIYSYINYLYEQDLLFQYENGTTGIKNLDINALFNNERIAIPNREVAKRFSVLFNTLYTKIQFLGKMSYNLGVLRDTLLPKLMSGEIRVPLVEQEQVTG
ncbi:MAG: restriction endonuclease subunit S, partial [Paenibacillus macerans]